MAVGLSGGIDSAVVAALLLKEGYEVIAVTMELFYGSNSAKAAGLVARTLQIRHEVIDLTQQFAKLVIEPFVTDYFSAVTPNPCVICNKKIKMGLLLKAAKSLGAQSLATGHYVRLTYDQGVGRHLILKGADPSKDQSYMLWKLEQDQLKSLLTPLGGLLKDDVRSMAKALGIPFLNTESQEICFTQGDDYVEFLKDRKEAHLSGGDIVTAGGRVLGTHDGLFNFTIGQRKGIGVSSPHPLYVIGLNANDNRVIVGRDKELYRKALIAREANFIPFDLLECEIRVSAKIRYNMEAKPASLKPLLGGQFEVIFDEAQRAITPGQSVVFYQDDVLIGGAIIDCAS